MAPIAKKTYSRKRSDLLRFSNNDSDPFDKLLSSPLKQEVDFKPLSYWRKNSECSYSEKYRNKRNKHSCELSDSDTSSDSRKLKIFGWKSLKRLTKEKHSRTSNLSRSNSIGQSINFNKNSFLKSKIKSVNQKWEITYDTEISNVTDLQQNNYKYVTIRRNPKKNKLIQPSHSFSCNGNLTLKAEDELSRECGQLKEKDNANLWKTYIIASKQQKSKGLMLDDPTRGGNESSSSCENSFDSFLQDSITDKNNNDISKFGTCEMSETTLTNELSASNLTESDDTDLDKTPFQDDSNNKINSIYLTSRISSLISKVSDMNISGKYKGNEGFEEETVHSPLQALENVTVVPRSDDGRRKTEYQFRNVTKRRNFIHPGRIQECSSLIEKEFRECEKENNDKFNTTVRYPHDEQTQIKLCTPKFEKPKCKRQTEFNDMSCLTSPMFESTRILGCEADSNQSLTLQESFLAPVLALKPGKQWMRSLSVLRQLQNESMTTKLISSNDLKGKNHQTLVKDIIQMQQEISRIEHPTQIRPSISVADAVSSLNDTSNSSRKGETDINDLIPVSFQKRRTIMGHTIKLLEPEDTLNSSSTFSSAFQFRNSISVFQEIPQKERKCSSSARDIILAQCDQTDILPFSEYFNEKTLKNCRKIGEGVFGEVFKYNNDTVFKVIPIEGDQEVNGEPQKKFEEILSEVIIASKLSRLRQQGANQTSGFCKMKKCWCVRGKYPPHLLDLWDDYDSAGAGSENDSPKMFNSDQLYIVLELEDGGKDLESFVFNSAEQCLSIFIQTAFTLAVAERAFEFEHRDLHWGNLLIHRTKNKSISIVLDDVKYNIPTKGVKVSIIDFTLSRILHEECCLFNDLSVDPTLFTSQGDYQFEIYRMMQREMRNDWSLFKPKTNVFWLHYIIDKMLKMVRYKNKSTQVHKKFLKELQGIESALLKYGSCSDFVKDMGFV
ncbi:hypothetical protein RUM43_007444 [Polyplax serrata]|uniref:non-specific serine/threonine protein kinase n=1 Tax=Polyplax serrata TaxID=468196 RepID=A0AAN8P1X2_POLSC